MTEIQLKELTLTNFCCYANARFVFNKKLTQIKGTTGCGKTTIRDAYLWVLGIDRDFAPKNDEKLIKGLETTVECVLQVNGVDYALKRTNKQKWRFNEDKGCDEFIGNESKFFIDNEPISATEYRKQVGILFDVVDYSMVADLQIFNAYWDWKKRRTLLFNLFNIEEKVSGLVDDEQFADIREWVAKGKDEQQIADIIRAEKRDIASKLQNIKSLVADKTAELQQLKEIDFAFFESEKARLEHDIDDLQRNRIEEDINLKTNITKLESTIDSLKFQLARENDNATSLEHASENVFVNELADTCPTCGRKFDKKQILSLKAKVELEKMAKMTELKEQAENCRLNTRNLQERITTLENDLRAKYGQLSEREGNTQSHAEYMKAYNQLAQQIEEINKTLYKKSLLADLQTKINALKQDNRVLLNKQAECLRRQSTLNAYIEKKIALVNNEINKHFDGIRFKFFNFNTANADNEYSPTCECMYDGVPYSKLSQGERIIADFATNNGLQKILNVNVPQFIDNKQDNTFPMESGCQIIELITCDETNIKAEFIKKEER